MTRYLFDPSTVAGLTRPAPAVQLHVGPAHLSRVLLRVLRPARQPVRVPHLPVPRRTRAPGHPPATPRRRPTPRRTRPGRANPVAAPQARRRTSTASTSPNPNAPPPRPTDAIAKALLARRTCRACGRSSPTTSPAAPAHASTATPEVPDDHTTASSRPGRSTPDDYAVDRPRHRLRHPGPTGLRRFLAGYSPTDPPIRSLPRRLHRRRRRSLRHLRRHPAWTRRPAADQRTVTAAEVTGHDHH